MIDRQKLESILCRRFPGASFDQIAAAANAIVGLDDEWEELDRPDLGRLRREQNGGAQFRFFRRVAAINGV
jgi:hypothetical protein